MADYSDIIRDLGDIPDYLANDDLRKIINVGLHDIMRHADVIRNTTSIVVDITVHEFGGGSRDVSCSVELMADPDSEINKPVVRRTVVEPEEQENIVRITTELGE